MQVKLYVDGANIEEMKQWAADPRIQGLTTNPTLMRKAGITDYEKFAREAIAAIPDKPISFEVFSDDFAEMEEEARIIHSWGGNTYIKIPITNTKGDSSLYLIKKLSEEGMSLNVTALFTLEQVEGVAKAVNSDARTIVSVFAGRIADAGQDPVPMMKKSVEILKNNPNAELLWASPREVFNVVQADECGCHIITATPDILKKVSNFGKDLNQFSLETVQMFYKDAEAAGFNIRERELAA